jgi:hypothetical protein
VKQSHYQSTEPVVEHRVVEELQKLNRLVGAHFAQQETLKEMAASEKEAGTKALEQVRELIGALESGAPIFVLKNDTLTTEEPDAQMEFEE